MNDDTQGELNDDLNHETGRETETDMDGNESTGTDSTGTDSTGTETAYDTRTGVDTDTDTRPAGRHPVNIGHLVMGLAFAGLVVIWALIEGEVIADNDIRWLLPIPWVLAGTAGLLAVTLGNRRRPNH